jgi:hypothetical protein
MPREGFEPATPASDRRQTIVLDLSAIRTPARLTGKPSINTDCATQIPYQTYVLDSCLFSLIIWQVYL